MRNLDFYTTKILKMYVSVTSSPISSKIALLDSPQNVRGGEDMRGGGEQQGESSRGRAVGGEVLSSLLQLML